MAGSIMAHHPLASFLLALAAALAAAKPAAAQGEAWECLGSDVTAAARGDDREIALAGAVTAWRRQVTEVHGAVFAEPWQAKFWTEDCHAAGDGTADMLCRIAAVPCRRVQG
ncbi:MAG: hypothetical protein KJZ85_08070 [Rhodobacteraceae bacterium]|jgi:hypothetical protein|nr:hypothetical protein [Paracoccaceae bacterium]